MTLAGLGWLAISDYFFKYAMTTYKKKPESKELSGRAALYRDKLGFKEFEKQEWILRVDSNISLLTILIIILRRRRFYCMAL